MSTLCVCMCDTVCVSACGLCVYALDRDCLYAMECVWKCKTISNNRHQEIEINHHPVEYCLTVATHYSNHVIQSPHSINLPHTGSHMNAACIAHVHTSD